MPKGRRVKPNRNGVPFTLYLSKDANDTLIDFCEANRPQYRKSDVLRDALIEYFERRGKWPRGKAATA